MNKTILTSVLIILLTSFLSAQQRDPINFQARDLKGIEVSGNSFYIKLNDRNYKYIDKQKGKFTVRDYSEYTDPSKVGEYKLPGRTLLVAVPPDSKPKFSIVEMKEELLNNVLPEINPLAVADKDGNVNYKETQLKKRTEVKSVLEVTGYTWYRNYYCAVIRINDISFNEQISQLVIKKGIKFQVSLVGSVNPVAVSPVPDYDSEIKDLIVNSEMAGQFRGKPKFGTTDNTGSWFNYSNQYVKIGTAGEGLFRITKSDFTNLGIDAASIDPHKFQLFESGVEQNIFLSNDTSVVFGDSDYVEFFGTRNFSKISPKILNADNEEYNEYLNRYTDTTFYFLTWGSNNGKRASSLSIPASGISDTLSYFSSVIHQEPNTMLQYLNSNDEIANQTPNWYKNKAWYWGWMSDSPAIDNDTVQLQDIYPGKTAKAFYKLVSAASNVAINSHNITFYANNTRLDSQVVDLNKQVLLKDTTLSSDLLTNGANVFTLHDYYNGTNPNYLAKDWFEIEYPKYLNLSGDSLYFEFRDNFSNKIAMIKVGNALSSLTSYEIFKVKPFFKKISNAQIIGNSLFFSDTVNTNDAYVIINKANISKPKFFYKKNFINLRQSRQTDYIAITHPLFMTSAQTYVNSIAQLYPVKNPLLVNVNDIYDEFAFGYPYPQSIKDFIGNALQSWQSPLPSYLLLIGDADYDYKGYIRKNSGISGGGNYIPSYGSPVSDIWYSITDSTSLPQMKVGRLPVNNSSDLSFYLSKVQNNFNAPFNDWNKHYLFFSGGDPESPYQISLFKMINDSIISGYVKPKPLAGSYTHFYKTITPPSNFGPYTAEQFNKAISSGAVFISYLGHSGTSTWDNGIDFVNDLQNNVNGNPLVTDFGCSTNKFAEPDIVCFGEGFILSGQALGYIANSSLGFTSTATTAPLYFYSSLLNRDSLFQVGEAHLLAKEQMFSDFGPSSDAFKLFSLCNTLLGDPIVNLKIPTKPNFSIGASDIIIQNNYINEAIDSVQTYVVINNYGTSINDSVKIDINHSLNNSVIQSQTFYLPVPDYKDTISLWLKTGHLPGVHILTVTLNGDNRIPEIYTSDNSISYKFSVESIEVKLLIQQKVENPALNRIKFLNPTISQFQGFNYVYQLSNDAKFTNPQGSITSAQTFYTNLGLTNLAPGQRYWFRIKVDGLGVNYSEPISFLNSGTSKYLLNDRVAFDNQIKDGTVYVNGNLVLGDTSRISVISAGNYAGSFCKISINGINLLSSTYFVGMGIVVFDPLTLNPDTSSWYNLYGNPSAVTQLVNLINSIPQGKIVAMGVCDDAQNNLTDSLKNAIKSLGSTLINQLAFRGSWALIGTKGAPGNVIEQIRAPYNGLIAIDSLYIKRVTSGNFITTPIGPASAWNNLLVNQNIPSGTETKFKVLGVKLGNTIDTLGYIKNIDPAAGLDTVDAKKYPYLKIVSELNLGSGSTPPSINSFGVNYIGLPELGTNNQAVTLSSDTFNVGKMGSLSFYVYNAGDLRADSIRVLVTEVMSDSAKKKIYDAVIDTINAESRRLISIPYSPLNGTRSREFIIQIDPDNRIYELYKDDNTFIEPFNVKSDTLPALLKITFDNQDILNGDYISPNPDIKIELNDPTIAPITDTSKVIILLNDKPVYYSNPAVTYTFNNSNPKMVVSYKPNLNDGSYTLTVLGKDAYGVLFDSTGTKKNFLVSNDAKILYAYNYPDPISKDTYFTFKLTQIPDELKINIYTVAGRLIKQINRTSSDLHYDFNRIYWDGKDQDGDNPANGVYFYKIIITQNGQNHNITQKMAIVR